MSDDQFPSSSQIIDLTKSPYPFNDKLTAVYVDTPTQTQSDKKEIGTPPKANTSSAGQMSPYSPSRKQIPPLPVPDNMGAQLKPTIPNSRRKFDINKLVFSGDANNTAALDELKSMLESIQNALVNIVERSKGNSSHIQFFGSQLKEFNESFKQRQENEEDLLTTSTYNHSQQMMMSLVDDLRLQLSSRSHDEPTALSYSSLSDELKGSIDRMIAQLESKLNAQLELNQRSQLELRIGILEDLKQSTTQTDIIEPIKEKLEEISMKQEYITESLTSSLENLEMKKAIENINSNLISMNIKLGNISSNETHRSNYYDELKKILLNLQQDKEDNNAKLSECLEKFTKDRLQSLESEHLSVIQEYHNQIEVLQKKLADKDVHISQLGTQHAEESMTILEEKLGDLRIQQLNEKLKTYEIKDELHLNTQELIQMNLQMKAESVKLDTELELKKKMLDQISIAYDSRLEKFITLAQNFESLKLKTESFISKKPEKELINNVKFDISYDQQSFFPSTSSSNSSSDGSYLGRVGPGNIVQKRNVTLNENMLPSSNKLQPIDMNPLINSDDTFFNKSLPGKRKLVIISSEKQFLESNCNDQQKQQQYQQQYEENPQKRKSHMVMDGLVDNKENYM